MGTSSIYGGPKDGLVPDFVTDDFAPAEDPTVGDDGAGSDGSDQNGQNADDNGENAVPLDVAPSDFIPLATPDPSLAVPLGPARSNFTRFTNTGSGKALFGAVSRYAASSGGSSGIVRRMPNSVQTASNVASLASTFAREGPTEALRKFNLQDLADRPAIEVFDRLVDELCPEGGTIDEAVARDAFIDAIMFFADQQLGNFGELSPDQMNEFLAEVMTRCIVSKVINEIGTNSLHGSANDNLYRDAENTLREYTAGAVRDALATSFNSTQSMTTGQMEKLISEVFTTSLNVLQATLEADA